MPRGRPKKIEGTIQQVADNKWGVVKASDEEAEKIKEESNPLFDLVKTLADNVQKLSEEIKEIKEKQNKTEIFTTGYAHTVQPVPIPAQPIMPDFLSTVPQEMLSVAKSILGDKFSFRCVASPDLPQFTFSVVVPPEYSPLKNQEDLRSRVIPNSSGKNGVEEWCKIVKQNVVKFLGKELPLNV